METFPFLLSICFIFFPVLCLLDGSLVEAHEYGFRVDLIPLDSPLSPFYNGLETRYERLNKAIRRSRMRLNHLSSSPSIQPTVMATEGSYLVKIALGTPPVEFFAIADTGSDLIWTQCTPCNTCYRQVTPFFNPKDSNTYKNIQCHSNPCKELPESSCSDGSMCNYSYYYGDRSFTTGVLASETLTFSSHNRRPISIPKITFGCGHNNNGTFGEHGGGLLGLGGGKLSLISQLGSITERKFSYCLVPLQYTNSSSSLRFGRESEIKGKHVVSTSLIPKHPDTYYYISLEEILIGDKKISMSNAGDGNIIVDSGTTLTYLPKLVFKELASALSEYVPFDQTDDPNGELEICYEVLEEKHTQLPDLEFRFTGATLRLNPMNTFIETSDGIICLSMAGSDEVSIIGNLAQVNFEILYDLDKKMISFAPTDCTQA